MREVGAEAVAAGAVHDVRAEGQRVELGERQVHVRAADHPCLCANAVKLEPHHGVLALRSLHSSGQIAHFADGRERVVAR
ncbi:hypothetical protein ACWDA3_51485 [Nonomuraea rubra]